MCQRVEYHLDENLGEKSPDVAYYFIFLSDFLFQIESEQFFY
jgi:hypothetical protein